MLTQKQVNEILEKDLTVDEILDNTPFIFALVDKKGYFKKVNSMLCDVVGYTPEELMQHPFITFIHPDDKDKTFEIYLSGDTFNKDAKPYKGFTNRYKVKGDGWAILEWWTTDLSIKGIKLACAIFKGYE